MWHIDFLPAKHGPNIIGHRYYEQSGGLVVQHIRQNFHCTAQQGDLHIRATPDVQEGRICPTTHHRMLGFMLVGHTYCMRVDVVEEGGIPALWAFVTKKKMRYGMRGRGEREGQGV